MDADTVNAVHAILRELDRIATALENLEARIRKDDRIPVALETLAEEGLTLRGLSIRGDIQP